MSRHPPRSTGLPQAVGRTRPQGPMRELPARAQREAWLLDVLAWLQTGELAAKVDLHGDRAPLPPVVLADRERVLGLDLLAAVTALKSRPRAFSQVAGRYTPLVVGARDTGARLVLQWWHLGEGPEPDAQVDKLAEAVAKYLDAEVRVLGMADARRWLERLRTEELPEALLERNPVAWALGIGAAASSGSGPGSGTERPR